MPTVSRSYRRLLYLLLALPVTLLFLALLYQLGMTHLEEQPRTLGAALEWAAETLTTTGYGRDAAWTHPVMQAFVVVVQFAGVLMVFLVFPIFLIPFIEERFEARLPTLLPVMTGQVLIYRFGPAVSTLIDELARESVGVVIFEEDEATARRLRERGRQVVYGNLSEEDPDLRNLVGARGLVLNGGDNYNAAMTLSARFHGYEGPIIAMVEDPNRRPPMLRAGATTAFTPGHVLGATLAARASSKISPRVGGSRHLGRHLEVAEFRIQPDSTLAGRTIAEASIRERTGSTVVALWRGGALTIAPAPSARLDPGTILVVAGPLSGVNALARLTSPVPQLGHVLVIGDSVGAKVAELLRDAGEEVRLLAGAPGPGVDVVGDHLDLRVLRGAGAGEAKAAVVALESDSATLFATAVLRNLAPDVILIAGVNRAENVTRIHRAGADFALSVSQVAGQLLAYHLLGTESLSLAAGIKIVSTSAGRLAGRPVDRDGIRSDTGCSVVALERSDRIVVELGGMVVEPTDIVYVSGTDDAVRRYFQAYPETREAHGPPRDPAPPTDEPAVTLSN